MTGFFRFLKGHPLLTGIICVAGGTAGIKLIHTNLLSPGSILLRLALTCMTFVALYLISGEKTFVRSGGSSTITVLKGLLPFLILGGVLGIIGITTTFIGKKGTINVGTLSSLVMIAALALSVGLFEEMTFRAVINDAIIYRFRSIRHVFLLAAVVSFLIFGGVHVFTDDLSSLSSIVQAVLKTAQTGIFGIALLICYWKTRNIWGCALVHAFFDFCSLLPNAFAKEVETVSYVSTGLMGNIQIAAYVVFCIVEIFFCIYTWKTTGKTIDFEELRREW